MKDLKIKIDKYWERFKLGDYVTSIMTGIHGEGLEIKGEIIEFLINKEVMIQTEYGQLKVWLPICTKREV